MLSSRICLLEKFGTSLVVISYFGPAHKSFLLLSQFNKKSREMMDKKFEGIMNCIVRTSICLKIEVNIKRIFLPCNLFRFDISINTEQCMKAFLKLIQNINDKNGYFFNEHFLHSRLLIDQLNIKTELIKNLYPAIKLLEKIEIIHSTISNNGYLIIEKSHLIDKVSLIYNIFLFKRMPFPHFIDKYNCKSMIDPIFESFRKIYELKLTELPTDIAIEYLKDLCYLKLKTGIIYLISHTLEQSESLSNPDYYKNGVNCLHFLFYKIHTITEQFISNINTIKPNELIIEFYDGIFNESDYMRFLTDFNELPHLELKRRTLEPKCKIVFHNATILIKLIDQEFMFIKGATFVCYLKIKELNKNYCFTNDNSDQNKDYSFIHLANLDNFKISNYYKVQDINEIKQLQDEFLCHLSESNSKCEFIISMKYLYSSDIDKEQASQLLSHEHCEQIIKEIYNAPKFSCSLMYLNGLLDINKYISLFPKNCSYSFFDGNLFQREIGDTYSSEFSVLIEQLKNIRISNIKILKLLTGEELKMVKEMISFQNSKVYLRKVEFHLENLSVTIDILNLLSECNDLESVELKYKNINFQKSTDLKKDLDKAKDNFCLKAGIIENFRVYHR